MNDGSPRARFLLYLGSLLNLFTLTVKSQVKVKQSLLTFDSTDGSLKCDHSLESHLVSSIYPSKQDGVKTHSITLGILTSCRIHKSKSFS